MKWVVSLTCPLKPCAHISCLPIRFLVCLKQNFSCWFLLQRCAKNLNMSLRLRIYFVLHTFDGAFRWGRKAHFVIKYHSIFFVQTKLMNGVNDDCEIIQLRKLKFRFFFPNSKKIVLLRNGLYPGFKWISSPAYKSTVIKSRQLKFITRH